MKRGRADALPPSVRERQRFHFNSQIQAYLTGWNGCVVSIPSGRMPLWGGRRNVCAVPSKAGHGIHPVHRMTFILYSTCRSPVELLPGNRTDVCEFSKNNRQGAFIEKAQCAMLEMKGKRPPPDRGPTLRADRVCAGRRPLPMKQRPDF